MVNDFIANDASHILLITELAEYVPCRASSCKWYIYTIAQVCDCSNGVGYYKKPFGNGIGNFALLVMQGKQQYDQVSDVKITYGRCVEQ